MSGNPTSTTHVVIGAGPTGTATARLLAATGDRVKVITRSGSGPTEPGIERVAADASDAARLRSLARGAATIFNCANPPFYGRWSSEWPPLAASLLGAAEAAGAGLVMVGNLYGYAPPSRPMRATDPLEPVTDVGRIRAQMWHDAVAAHDAGRVRVTEARASDFIGPGLGKNAHMGDRVVPRLLRGKSVTLLGRVDVDHSWTAIDDVAETLVTLARDERSWGRAWHVPTVAPITQRDLVHRMCALAGVEPVKVSTIPSVVVRAAGLFVPTMREVHGVDYQFRSPFVIDSAETTATFDITPTPLDKTLMAALTHYGLDRGSDLHLQR